MQKRLDESRRTRKIQIKRLLQQLPEEDPWFRCKYILNAYEGLEQGLPYWRAQSSMMLAARENESSEELLVKENAPEVLRNELPKLPPQVICLGEDINEPYQHCERDYELVHRCLDYIRLNQFPLHIITRTTLIERDIQLLRAIANQGWCYVSFALSTVDPKLAKVLEPLFPNPQSRLKTMQRLVENGIPCGVAMMPVFPYITDSAEHIDQVFEQAKAHRASYVIDKPLTLQEDAKQSMFDFLGETPKLRRFKKRYERLYKNRPAPYGKTMQNINRICFDASGRHEISRRIPPYTQE